MAAQSVYFGMISTVQIDYLFLSIGGEFTLS
jgi:hypothetical protein